MKKNISKILILVMIISIGFMTSCNNDPDVIEVREETKSLITTKSTLNSSDRIERFNYFKTKIEAGEDISIELSHYVNNMEIPEMLKNTGYEQVRNEMLAILNPDDYNCNSEDIALSNYIASITSEWTPFERFIFAILSYHPQIDALYVKDPNYKKHVYGLNGEFTNVLNRSFKDLKRFWDIESGNIGMTPMKGSTYLDFNLLVLIEEALFPGQSDDENIFWATLAQDTFGSDAFWNFKHPLLTFNAFAASLNFPFPNDRIVMGDGLMQGYAEIGLGDVTPQAILAHEFGHHIQFDNGYFVPVAPEDQPEATRRTELMADAYSAYYLTHKRGATMNFKRVVQFLEAFYNIGDCQFLSGNHHGTYEQRLAAAQWGFDLADSASPKGKILGSHEFFEKFEAALDGIVNCSSCLALPVVPD